MATSRGSGRTRRRTVTAATGPLPESVRAAATALSAKPVWWSAPESGLSAAERHVVQLDTGIRVFVKGATDANTARWLRTERRAVGLVGPGLAATPLAWIDGPDPVLVTTDLSDAYWPAGTGTTHWRPGDITGVFVALERLRGVAVPADLPVVADWPAPTWRPLVSGTALLAAGLCSPTWLDRNGLRIAECDEQAELVPEVVVHGDVRSDNLCVVAGGSVRLVDWSVSGRGHRYHDLARLLPTLRLEGGPPPAAVLAEPAPLIARLTGDTVARAVGPEPMPGWLRAVFVRLAAIDLDWLATVLDLDPVEPPVRP